MNQPTRPPRSRLRRWGLAAVLLAAVILLLVAYGNGRSGPPEAPSPPAPDAEAETTPPAGEADKEDVARWQPPDFTERREERGQMARTIENAYKLADEEVLDAMRSVPRHAFVPADHRDEAYADTPLPIGYGQTISQPYIVAEMTRQLKLKPTSKVLEVGTGSGYQAAVLTEFTPFVTTIEIIEPLAAAARRRLTRLGYDVVAVRHGDGYYGWEEKAPFDGIIVTCATGQIPPPLLRQLAPGGRMIVPVGAAFATQSLMLVAKDAEGTVRSRSLMAVRFVPLVRKDVSE
jgi:protein-L-isoaspartate(D-aspartate) O-methyltransferase